MDDGTRKLDAAQFEALDGKLGGIDGAIDRLGENISDPDTSVAAEVSKLKDEVISLRETLSAGFAELNSALSAASDNLGKWLAAIALASSTPEDNSAEVQKRIDELKADLKPEADAFEAAAEPQ